MTGSNKWRRPLAVLASVATLATMGVVAGTANAATDAGQTLAKVTFQINGNTVGTIPDLRVGTSIADKQSSYQTSFAPAAGGYVFTGWDKSFVDQVNGDVTVSGVTKAKTAATEVKFVTDASKGHSGLIFPDGADVATGTTGIYYVNAGSTLGSRVPLDAPGDGNVVTRWKVSAPGVADKYVDTADLSKVSTAGLAGKTLTITAEKNAPAKWLIIKSNGTGYATGAYADGDTSNAKADYVVDIAKGQSVTLPKTWSNYPGKHDRPAGLTDGATDYEFGKAYTFSGDSDVTLQASETTSKGYTVEFLDENGVVKFSGTAEQPAESNDRGATLSADQRKAIADITIDGFVVKGWQIDFGAGNVKYSDGTVVPSTALLSNDDLDNVYFTGPVTFKPVQGGTTGTVEVTFRDETYVGNNKNVVVDAQGGEYLSADKFPTFTRKGYVFSKWVLSDGNGNPVTPVQEFDSNALIGDGYWANNFTVVAVWEKVDSSVLDAALAYVPALDAADAAKYGVVADANGWYESLFSPASWSAYKGVYQSVVNEKQQLGYKSSNGKVSDDDAARLVTKLSDAWKDLVFVNNDKNFVVPSYRFFNRVNGEHLFTSDSKEIASLKANHDWTYEGEAFQSLARPGKDDNKDGLFDKLSSFDEAAKKAGVNDAVKDKLASIADPITVSVYRLFNRENGEHLFTTDANEYNILVSRNWSGENVAFYAPKYSSTKNVYRLFDPAKGQHLFTLDSNEAKILSTKYGWSNEGVVFKAL